MSYLSEYSEIVLNYGLSLIFCVAFPLGPAFYWAYNWLEQYTEVFQLQYFGVLKHLFVFVFVLVLG